MHASSVLCRAVPRWRRWSRQLAICCAIAPCSLHSLDLQLFLDTRPSSPEAAERLAGLGLHPSRQDLSLLPGLWTAHCGCVLCCLFTGGAGRGGGAVPTHTLAGGGGGRDDGGGPAAVRRCSTPHFPCALLPETAVFQARTGLVHPSQPRVAAPANITLPPTQARCLVPSTALGTQHAAPRHCAAARRGAAGVARRSAAPRKLPGGGLLHPECTSDRPPACLHTVPPGWSGVGGRGRGRQALHVAVLGALHQLRCSLEHAQRLPLHCTTVGSPGARPHHLPRRLHRRPQKSERAGAPGLPVGRGAGRQAGRHLLLPGWQAGTSSLCLNRPPPCPLPCPPTAAVCIPKRHLLPP